MTFKAILEALEEVGKIYRYFNQFFFQKSVTKFARLQILNVTHMRIEK